jgi:phosphatidate cytidylyltransferase
VPPGFAAPLLFVPALAGIVLLSRNRTLYILFALLIVVAGFGLLFQRDSFGFVWLAWLIVVVVATDVFGYFAGRMIGGPKFWPKVSPKKTWSGTAAGWFAAAAVGAAFMAGTGAGAEIIGVSVALSMASQVGDISESAVKRKMGVKDASTLIPGHGGVMDRFDGMLGASVFLLFIEQIVDFPPGLAAG